MNPNLQRDYPELEGKVITVIESVGCKYEAIVAGVNFDIGITIVLKDDCGRSLKGDNLVCWPGELAQQKSPDNYKALFYHVVRQIKSGVYKYGIDDKIANYSYSMFNDMVECPFTGV